MVSEQSRSRVSTPHRWIKGGAQVTTIEDLASLPEQECLGLGGLRRREHLMPFVLGENMRCWHRFHRDLDRLSLHYRASACGCHLHSFVMDNI
jgi:hypothetical protein